MNLTEGNRKLHLALSESALSTACKRARVPLFLSLWIDLSSVDKLYIWYCIAPCYLLKETFQHCESI